MTRIESHDATTVWLEPAPDWDQSKRLVPHEHGEDESVTRRVYAAEV